MISEPYLPESEFFPQSVLPVTTISRPMRVAFLVDPVELTHLDLNQILQFSIRRWGGRFYGIFPTNGNEIDPGWWSLLVILDPDIIYSLVNLEEALVHRINRYILPMEIYEVPPEKKAGLNRYNLIDEYKIRAIGIEDIPQFRWVNRPPIYKDPIFVHLREEDIGTLIQNFALSNFGTLPNTYRITRAFRDVPHQVKSLRDLGPVRAVHQLNAIQQNIILPIDLCRFDSPRHYFVEAYPSSYDFQIIVGDSVAERIYAWDRALISERDAEDNTFWLPEELILNKEMHVELADWIKRKYAARYNEGSGSILSYTLDKEKLNPLAEALGKLVRFNFSVRKLSINEFICPQVELKGQVYWKRTENISFSENSAVVDFPRPPFFSDKREEFGWMIDAVIQYHPERYYYTNIRPNWQLPKRLGLGEVFFPTYRRARINCAGFPSTAIMAEESSITLRIPPDLAILSAYLDRRHTNSKHPQLISAIEEVKISDKGQYLRGIVRLFENIYTAGELLLDRFWRHVFRKMSEEKAELTEENLRALFGQLKEIPDEKFDDWKRDELHALLESAILLQGAELKCHFCASSFWYLIDDLKTNVRCNGCLNSFATPPAPKWSFRLNALVSNALLKQGTLSVLHALYHLQRGTSNMFIYLPCQDVFLSGSSERYTDIDIVAISDGSFLIGEVKAHPQLFKESDFEKLGVLAKDLLPDKVIVAAEGDDWGTEVLSHIAKLSRELKV